LHTPEITEPIHVVKTLAEFVQSPKLNWPLSMNTLQW